MQVTWKFGWFVTNLLVNSSIGTKWLKPGLGIIAMWHDFPIETQLV
jgi:hypothetical protein